MAQPIVARDDFFGYFNYIFLIWLAIFGLVAVVFLFYFNRIVAFLLFSLIRAYTWFFYRVHVKCQAFQFSLLGGRLFLRGLSYHGENETILVHQVYVTWQYWYRRVAHVDIRPLKQEQESTDSSSELSEEHPEREARDHEADAPVSRKESKCRISARVRGVEWFVYNRSPAYDGILAAARTAATQGQEQSSESGSDEKAINLSSQDVLDGEKLTRASLPVDQATFDGAANQAKPEPPFFLKLLPIYVDCSKAAMVLGNQHTRSVLVAKVERARGKINAHPSGPHDVYRQAFEFDLTDMAVQFVPNEDYVEPLLTAGAKLNGVDKDSVPPGDDGRKPAYHKASRHRTRHALGKLLPQFRRSVESFDRRSGSMQKGETSLLPDLTQSGMPRWMGLTRYLDEEEEEELEHERWQAIEYAEAQTVAEFSSVFMNFYWDVPGPVKKLEKLNSADAAAADAGDINGSLPPEWSLDIRLGRGVVQYGPWADRQRVDFMTVFFPTGYMDAVPALPLRPGQTRISTVFKIMIALDDKVDLRLLTREPSKDWKFKDLGQDEATATKTRGRSILNRSNKRAKSSVDPRERPAGWVSVSIAANTTVGYDMDMLPRKSGFKNDLKIDVVAPEIQSSVNQDVLMRSESMTVSADISNPLGWNDHRSWRFDISSDKTELFMLREHAFLIQDLVEDFTLGPPPSFYTFVPFSYDMNLAFDDLRILLNANEANIIDEPTVVDENTLLSLEPRKLVANVNIPANQLKPVQSTILFSGNLEDTKFRVLTPAWNTYHSLLDVDAIGKFPQIKASGSYNAFSESAPSNTDTLLMRIHGDAPQMYLYGFLIRYFLNFQENYFGKDVHFQTLEEYQGRLDKPGRKHADDNEHKPSKPTSDLDVVLSITTKNPSILLPSSMYTDTSCIRLDLEDGFADLRFTNYYMDLQTSLSPISISHFVPSSQVQDHRNPDDLSVQAFIDGATITGHRLFGVPPAEPTYACNWDFEVGHITGESSVEFLGALVAGIQAVVYALDDKENALPGQEEEALYDITFLRASIKPIRLWLLVDQTAFLCELAESRVEFNDWSRRKFSERLFLIVPNIVLAVVDRSSSLRSGEASEKAITYGYLQTSVDFRMVTTKADFREERRKQQEHLNLHDSRTTRTPWLIRDATSTSTAQFNTMLAKIHPPASQFPQVPNPVLAPTGGISRSLRTSSSKTTISSTKSKNFLLPIDRVGQERFERRRSIDEVPLKPPHYPSERGYRDPPKGSMSMRRMTTTRRAYAETPTSSYASPHFSFRHVMPSDHDVPSVELLVDSFRKRSDSDITADEFPIEDDGMVHVSFMINMESGLRIMCTPQALEGANQLLANIISKRPETMLDALQIQSLEGDSAVRPPDKIPKSVQIRLELPAASVRIRHHHIQQSAPSDSQQMYQVALYGLLTFGRIGANRPAPLGKTPSSLHVSLSQVEIEAVRSLDMITNDAQVIAKLIGLTLWAHEAEEITGTLGIRAMEIASLNRRTEHLATLVNEAGTLADSLAAMFATTVFTQQARVQTLVYRLVTIGQHVADPPVLSSASFISRSSFGHVRASDSWKVLMRLQWILRSMNDKAKRELLQLCQKDKFELQENSREQIISCFENWRGWDLPHINSCSFSHALFKDAAPTGEGEQELPKPIRVALNTGIITLTVDPARKGNRVLSDGLAIAVESLLDTADEAESNPTGSIANGRRTTVEVVCEKFMVEMKLELLDAVRGIFSHVKNLEASQQLPKPPLPKVSSNAFIKQEIHGILFVKRSLFAVRSKNLKASLRSESFSCALLGTQPSRSNANLVGLLHSHTCSVEASSRSRPIAKSVFFSPSFHVKLKREQDVRTKNQWNIGGNCFRITTDVTQNALSIIAVADSIISEEYVYLRHFLMEIERTNSATALLPANQPVELPVEQSVHLALELSSYQITVVIFSSLRYRLEGRGARISLAPSASDIGYHRLDMDLREHAHSILNKEETELMEIARLSLPPINGKLNLRQSEEDLAISVDVHMSVIKIDASAVHGLFSALSRTEITRFKEHVARDVNIVKMNAESVNASFTGDQLPQAEESTVGLKKEVHYTAHVNIDGITISAHSSKSLKTSAELLVDSGPIGLYVSNQNDSTGATLPFPNLDLRLNEVKVVLESLEDDRRYPCGQVRFAFEIVGRSDLSDGKLLRAYNAAVNHLEVDIYTETASMIIDILGFLQQRFKHFNLTEEIHTFRAQRRKRAKSHIKASEVASNLSEPEEDIPVALFDAVVTFKLCKLQVAWRVASLTAAAPISEPEDLIFSIDVVDLRTREGSTARLEIKNLQLQLVPQSQLPTSRSRNSALLPEVVFKVAYLSTSKDRRLAFQALGKALDLRLTSQFILPLSNVQKSIAVATRDLRSVMADWNQTLVESDPERTSVLGGKKLGSLIVDADFAGAVVFMEGKDATERMRGRSSRMSRHGRLGQYEDRNSTVLTSPGVAFKVEFQDAIEIGRSLNAEIKIAASENKLQPMFVPLVLEVASSVKELVGQPKDEKGDKTPEEQAVEEDTAKAAATNVPDPTTILGDCKLNVGFRICEQSFSLTCEPIAKVTATARFDDIYITINTVQPDDGVRFFTVSSVVTGLETTVKHVYSREPTGKFQIQSVGLSMMNSEHVNGMRGISTILNISPMTVVLNVRQLQDFLTFREIWYPVEIRPVAQAPAPSTDQSIGGVQRYYQATATNSFSWNAVINVAGVDLQLDLGQSVGKLSFSILKLWVASRKDSEQEQNLCLGFDSIGIQSKGRMSGSVELRNLQLRTNIVWPDKPAVARTPLVQASLTFADLKARAAFDYQTFAVIDFQSLGFLLYNTSHGDIDRLICTVNGDKMHAYCTANAASQGVALYQAVDKLINEKLTAFEISLKQMEKFQRQKAAAGLGLSVSQDLGMLGSSADESEMTPVRLQVNVVVSLDALKIGVYPRAFTDNQIFKLEALDALARFGVNIEDGNIHTLLTVVLGQLRVAVSNVNRTQRSRTLAEVSIDDVVQHSTGSRGGTILKVPRVVAAMQTWQPLHTRQVDYIFKSTFEGKVEVGWNYARISSIRAMWETHSKALEQRLGKPLPQSAVQITHTPRPDAGIDREEEARAADDPDKATKELITAVVNVPTSKYQYHAREPPVIQTPQLRDMGEATPPLEWIGLQRDKLPNLTHQVIIVPLLEFAKEVEDAYGKILGAK